MDLSTLMTGGIGALLLWVVQSFFKAPVPVPPAPVPVPVPVPVPPAPVPQPNGPLDLNGLLSGLLAILTKALLSRQEMEKQAQVTTPTKPAV